VLWPERDGDLGAFLQKLTITHVRNWQENRQRVGYGHLYQGRYKSFPVESDEHFYQVLRYVERNALRANLVRLDEILICGPPGLGKSALVNVLAQELCVPFTEILAQSITNTIELNAVLLGATEGLLFLDEMHLLHPVHQHALLQVLDKRRIFLSGGKSVQSIPVAPFTLALAARGREGSEETGQGGWCSAGKTSS
jgi:MoxR-like ATPase